MNECLIILARFGNDEWNGTFNSIFGNIHIFLNNWME